MNKNRILEHLCTLAATLLLAGCSQNELGNEQGTPLPAGQYPLELTAGGLEAVAVPAQTSTRGTVDGDWNDVRSVMVQDGENVPKAYHITAKGDNKTATLSSDDPFWWTNVIETKTVTAWHPAKYPDDENINFANRIPVQGDKWSVPADQSMEDFDVSDYDFIYAYKKIPFANHKDTKLEFRHLLSKVVVNLKKSEYLSANSNDVSVSLINCALSGNFKNSGENLSLISSSENQDKSITMRKVAADNEAFASYNALVFPQGVSDRSINVLVKVGATSYTWLVRIGENTFRSGICYTFNITVDAKVLNVTVEESIGWNPDGASGSGSVTLLKTIDLSQVNDKITIGDGAYRLKGNDQEIQHPIIVNGNADITFEDEVKIKVNGDDENTKGLVAMKIADDKKVKLTVKGTGHSLTSTSTDGDYGCGIELGNRASIEIIGEGITNSSLTVKAGCRNSGIGPKSFISCECEGITIKDIDLTVQTGEPKIDYTSFGAAIGLNTAGANNTQSLKFIHIENAKITAVGHGSGTCIGTGPLNYGNMNIDEIKIENSVLVLKVEEQRETEATYLQGACIGFGAAVKEPNNYSHTIGSIIITNTTFDESCSGHHIVGSGFENAWTFQFTTSIKNGNGFTVNGTTCKTYWDSASSHD